MKILKLEEYASPVFEIGEIAVMKNVEETDGRKWNGEDCVISRLPNNESYIHSFNGFDQLMEAGQFVVKVRGWHYSARPDQLRKK